MNRVRLRPCASQNCNIIIEFECVFCFSLNVHSSDRSHPLRCHHTDCENVTFRQMYFMHDGVAAQNISFFNYTKNWTTNFINSDGGFPMDAHFDRLLFIAIIVIIHSFWFCKDWSAIMIIWNCFSHLIKISYCCKNENETRRASNTQNKNANARISNNNNCEFYKHLK